MNSDNTRKTMSDKNIAVKGNAVKQKLPLKSAKKQFKFPPKKVTNEQQSRIQEDISPSQENTAKSDNVENPAAETEKHTSNGTGMEVNSNIAEANKKSNSEIVLISSDEENNNSPDREGNTTAQLPPVDQVSANTRPIGEIRVVNLTKLMKNIPKKPIKTEEKTNIDGGVQNNNADSTMNTPIKNDNNKTIPSISGNNTSNLTKRGKDKSAQQLKEEQRWFERYKSFCDQIQALKNRPVSTLTKEDINNKFRMIKYVTNFERLNPDKVIRPNKKTGNDKSKSNKTTQETSSTVSPSPTETQKNKATSSTTHSSNNNSTSGSSSVCHNKEKQNNTIIVSRETTARKIPVISSNPRNIPPTGKQHLKSAQTDVPTTPQCQILPQLIQTNRNNFVAPSANCSQNNFQNSEFPSWNDWTMTTSMPQMYMNNNGCTTYPIMPNTFPTAYNVNYDHQMYNTNYANPMGWQVNQQIRTPSVLHNKPVITGNPMGYQVNQQIQTPSVLHNNPVITGNPTGCQVNQEIHTPSVLHNKPVIPTPIAYIDITSEPDGIPSVAATSNYGPNHQNSSPKGIKMAFIDRTHPSGLITDENWLKIEEKLLDALISEIDNPKMKDIFTAFNGFQWERGIKVIECNSQKAVQFLENSLKKMGNITKNVECVPSSNVIERKKVWISIPPKPKLSDEVILKLLKQQNKDLLSNTWQITHTLHGDCIKINLEISLASADLIKKSGNQIKFGMNKLSVAFSQLHGD